MQFKTLPTPQTLCPSLNVLLLAPIVLLACVAVLAVGIVGVLFPHFSLWALLLLPATYGAFHGYRRYLQHIQEHVDQMAEQNRLNQAIVASLATAIDAKDRYTGSRVNRVQCYAVTLATAAGLTGSELEAVRIGALVHDIGKLGIPDHILGKPGKLTPEEFKRIQRHVEIGAEILSQVPFPFPVVDVVLTHHERWDGLGYPRGFRGEEIPIGGRIIAIADVFDALTSHRPYRRALSHEQAIQVLRDGAGRQFDPQLVSLFEKVLPRTITEIRRMEALAAEEATEVSTEIPRFSALSQISQAAAEMAALCDVAHSLAEQDSVEEITATVVHRTLALLPGDAAVLYLKEPNGEYLVANAAEGLHQEQLAGMRIPVGKGISGWVLRTQRPQVNVSAALDLSRRLTADEANELCAATAVPLVHGGESLGVLAVYTVSYSVLAEHHLHVLAVLAEYASAAIQNLRRQERVEALALTDPLTGLANSRGLVRHLEHLTLPQDQSDTAVRSPFSVVMLDLDHFKQVNDTLGHLHGDDLLRAVATRLASVARREDLLCRYAGDEFVMVLPGVTRESAASVAGRIRQAVDALPPVEGKLRVSASLGVATFPDDGSDGRALLNAADRRMYEDKFARRHAAARDYRYGRSPAVGSGLYASGV